MPCLGAEAFRVGPRSERDVIGSLALGHSQCP